MHVLQITPWEKNVAVAFGQGKGQMNVHTPCEFENYGFIHYMWNSTLSGISFVTIFWLFSFQRLFN